MFSRTNLHGLNTPDSFKNSLSYDDVQLPKDLPIVVKMVR